MSNSFNILLLNQIHTALLEENITLIGSESCPKPVKLRAVLSIPKSLCKQRCHIQKCLSSSGFPPKSVGIA